MKEMPLELLLVVMKRLPKKDNKSLRCVSKSLSVVATPLVFDSVYLSHDSADFIKAESILKNYASSINAIVLCPVRYGSMYKHQYRDLIKREHGLTRRMPSRWRFEDHIDMGYEALMGRHRQRSSRVTETFEPIFRAILRDAPNLRKFIIIHRKRYAELEVAKFCRWEDCAMPAEMHGIFELTPTQCVSQATSYLLHDRHNALPRMLSAISASGSNLRELIVEHEGVADLSNETVMQSFLRITDILSEEVGLMSNLTKLKLAVDNRRFKSGNGSYSRWVYEPFGTKKVANSLARARNLEKLSLTIVDFYIQDHAHLSPNMFHYILDGCRFPKLRIFLLDGCGMEGHQIMDFLGGSPDLKHLVLRSCSLKDYKWAALAELIKANTHLTALSLEHLFRRSWDGSQCITHFLDYEGGVEKFLLHGGPNPFVCESQQAYDRVWRTPADPALLEVERKVDWYHEQYF